MNSDSLEVSKATSFLVSEGFEDSEIGIVLGTGLSTLLSNCNINVEVDYADIPGFMLSTVESHSGKLVSGELSGKRFVAMNGRFHFYEGYTMQQITFPIRVMKQLGIKYLLLSNACGGLNKKFNKGDLMLIDDLINLLPSNPLIGPNNESEGTRFPDMSQPCDPYLKLTIQNAASVLGILLHEGTYAAVSGPNLESRAEYRYLTKIGADVVGMSTAPEIIASRHMNLPCAAVSVITDLCDPDDLKPVALADIIAAASLAEPTLNKLFEKAILELN